MIADKILWLQASLITIVGIVAPVLAVMKTAAVLSGRDYFVMFLSGLLGGSVALSAWLSTTFALSPGQIAKRQAALAAQ